MEILEEMWVSVARVNEVPGDSGVCAKVGDLQIAVFNCGEGQWFACQNMCPHRADMVLARGLIGDVEGEHKVACPQHKKTFSLRTGECLSGEDYAIRTFPVKVVDGELYVAADNGPTTH